MESSCCDINFSVSTPDSSCLKSNEEEEEEEELLRKEMETKCNKYKQAHDCLFAHLTFVLAPTVSVLGK